MLHQWKTIGRRLLADERGESAPIFLILCTTIVALGGMVGLASVRDQITQQLGDIAVALDHVDQSFSYTVVVEGTTIENASYSDPGNSLDDAAGAPPACLVFTAPTPGQTEAATPTTPGTVP